MSLDVDVTTNGERLALSRTRLIEIAHHVLPGERVRNALVSVTMLDRRAMARLNMTHIRHRGPTDVISFGFTRATPRDPVIGDIYICPSVGRANAVARHEPARRAHATRCPRSSTSSATITRRVTTGSARQCGAGKKRSSPVSSENADDATRAVGG
jgi:ssRNA-specific RNase YbeY (16S rRNA maturation enzyme)